MKGYQLKQLVADIGDNSDIQITLTKEFVAQVKDLAAEGEFEANYSFNLRLTGHMIDGQLVAAVQFIPTDIISIGRDALLKAKAENA